MKVDTLGKGAALKDLPNGALFGSFVHDEYVRFLKLEAPEGSHDIPVLCLGPFLQSNSLPGAALGPCIFIWEDEPVIVEEETTLVPTGEPLSLGHRMELGAIALDEDGRIYVICRSGQGRRAMIDLSTGAYKENSKTIGFFPSYVLACNDKLNEKRIVFDSAKELERQNLKRSA